MHNSNEGLVGPQSEDRERIEDEMTEDGQPIWMAFLSDPEALSVSKEEVQDAKNALAELREKDPEVISMCQRAKTIEECQDKIYPAKAA